MKKIKKYDGVVENTIEAFFCVCSCTCADCSCWCPDGNALVSQDLVPADAGIPVSINLAYVGETDGNYY